jgi:hypothetical protein
VIGVVENGVVSNMGFLTFGDGENEAMLEPKASRLDFVLECNVIACSDPVTSHLIAFRGVIMSRSVRWRRPCVC